MSRINRLDRLRPYFPKFHFWCFNQQQVSGPSWTRTNAVSLWGIYSPLPSLLGIPTQAKSAFKVPPHLNSVAPCSKDCPAAAIYSLNDGFLALHPTLLLVLYYSFHM